MMRFRWPIPAVTLCISLGAVHFGPAYPKQDYSTERDQKILQIQQLIQDHDLAEASRKILEAAKQYPADAGLDNLRGIVEAQQGNYAAAEKSFSRALKREPKFTGASLNLGRLYQENFAGDAQQALLGLRTGKRDDLVVTLLESLEKRQALSPELLRALGLAYEGADRLVEARAALERSITPESLTVGSLLELARVARKQKDYQGSLGYLAHARDLEPTNAGIHYYFGLVCMDLNLVAEGRNSFEKAVQMEPENPEYNYAMGVSSTFRHDPGEAVPYFGKYLKLRPQDPRGKLALGAALYRAKDYEAAVPRLEEATKTAETATAAHYYLGAIALQDRRLGEARNELELALKSKPDYVDALAELGQYYLKQKDYLQAEKQIRRAFELDPEHYTANFYLLTLYTRTRDARQEAQAKHFEELKKLLAEKTQEILRIVEVRPLENP